MPKYFKKILILWISLAGILAPFKLLSFQQGKSINILTWWGYLDKPWIEPYIREKCNVNISFDEYYTNDEFNKRWAMHKTDYDIVIFEDTFFNVIANDLKSKGTNIANLATNYLPDIKKQYLYKNYPKNILYFFQSASGFLWNPQVITLHQNDTTDDIFSAAGNHSVILLDDPAVIITFFHTAFYNKNKFDEDSFFKLTKNTKFYIANDYNKIYESKDFAFSYLWSGDAILALIKTKNKYQYTINPKLSYISSDLIAQISKSPESTCVVKVLASKDFLSKLQNDTYYFSPYGNIDKIKSKTYMTIYKYYLSHLEKLKWVDSTLPNQYENASETWKLIKLRSMQ